MSSLHPILGIYILYISLYGIILNKVLQRIFLAKYLVFTNKLRIFAPQIGRGL